MKFIKPSQHIVITPETELGKKCNVIKILEDTLIKNGFTKTIWEKNVSNLGDEEF